MTSHRFLLALATVCLLPLLPGTTRGEEDSNRVAINIDAGGGRLHRVVIELDVENAPQTSANFKKLASEGFYNGIAFHRVVPNYLVQVGDPLTRDPGKKNLWGTGGPGYTVPAELGQKHLRGSVAMARLSDGVNPDRASSGSQFYICLADIPALDGDYTVFGRVVSGLEHIERVSNAAADTNNNPVTRIAITGTSLVDDPSASIASTTDPDAMPTPAPTPTPTPAPDAPPTPAPSPAPTPEPTADPAPGRTTSTIGEALASASPAPAPAPVPTPAPEPTPPPTAAPSPEPAPPLPTATPGDEGPAGPAAELTQPSLAEDMSVAPPGDDDGKPKKKEGFFTRLIKKVW